MLGRLTRVERLFTRAQNLVALGYPEKGLEVFCQVQALDPSHSGVYLHWALALSDLGCFDKAYETMQQALALQPSNAVLYMFLGQLCFDHADYKQAKQWCETALEFDPSNTHTHGLLGLISFAQGEILQGYQRLTRPLSDLVSGIEHVLYRAGQIRPPSLLQLATPALQSRILLWVETYFLHHHIAARPLSQQLIEMWEPSSATLASRALECIDRWCTCIVMGGKRLGVLLRHVGSAVQRAQAQLHVSAEQAYYLGDASVAITLYCRLLDQSPKSFAIKQRLFDLYYEQGDFHHALAFLKALTQYGTPDHNPSPWESLCLGELFYLDGQISEAARYLGRVSDSSVKEFKLFYYRGLCDLQAGRKASAQRLFGSAAQTLNPGICRLRLDELKRLYTGPKQKESISATDATMACRVNDPVEST